MAGDAVSDCCCCCFLFPPLPSKIALEVSARGYNSEYDVKYYLVSGCKCKWSRYYGASGPKFLDPRHRSEQCCQGKVR
jgi:hypothetical protein